MLVHFMKYTFTLVLESVRKYVDLDHSKHISLKYLKVEK